MRKPNSVKGGSEAKRSSMTTKIISEMQGLYKKRNESREGFSQSMIAPSAVDRILNPDISDISFKPMQGYGQGAG